MREASRTRSCHGRRHRRPSARLLQRQVGCPDSEYLSIYPRHIYTHCRNSPSSTRGVGRSRALQASRARQVRRHLITESDRKGRPTGTCSESRSFIVHGSKAGLKDHGQSQAGVSRHLAPLIVDAASGAFGELKRKQDTIDV